MPHFYFHLSNHVAQVQDEQGRELADLDAARAAALADIRSIMSDEVKRGLIDLRGHIDIADDADRPVVRVEFAEAFRIALPEKAS